MAVSACGTIVPIGTSPTATPTSTASVSAQIQADQRKAEAQLQDWLWNPRPGTLTYNTIQVTVGDVNVMSILTGPFDPTGTAEDPTGSAALTGTIATLSGTTTVAKTAAIQTGGKVYTAIPTAMQIGDKLGKLWVASSVGATWTKNAVHSGWWQVLYQADALKADGSTSLGSGGNAVNVNVYSENLDLTKLKNIPKALLESAALGKAGTSTVEVDVYIDAGTNKLARVTYKFGMPVRIDAPATAGSTAGYEVDLSGLEDAGASPSPSPIASSAAPDPANVAAGPGDEDLAALLPF